MRRCIGLGLAFVPLVAFGQGDAKPNEPTYEGKLRVPPGFSVTEFARVRGARFMALGPDGAVYVSQPNAGQVTRLVDQNKDGIAEQPTVAATGLDRPHGLTFRDGQLYVANTGAVVRLTLDASGKAMGSAETVAKYSSGGGHWTRTVVFGRDGGMYVSIGSSCNVCVEADSDRASVVRFNADGKGGRVYARGLRNAVGMAVNPTTGAIWVTQNERDNLRPNHQDLPPEEINILAEGGHFGWPYCYGDRQPTPDAVANEPNRCPSTIPPALPLQAHSAPLGIAFLDRASAFPQGWRSSALVAYHGSWNRDTPTGAKVVRVLTRDGKPVGVEDFIVGWQDASGKRWGRPVDVVVASDGAVLISDDQAGVIYRVTHK